MTKEVFFKKHGKEKILDTMIMLAEFTDILPEGIKDESSKQILRTVDLLSDLLLIIKKQYKYE